MSLAYRAVGWNRQKRIYDATLGGALLTGLAVYAAATFGLQPATTPETFVIRFTAIAAICLLHVILAIGPLARLNPRFLPLLYNRRHLGVTMFLLALVHGAFATIQFHAGGDRNPLVSVLTAYRSDYLSALHGDVAHFPFESLGLAALCMLFVMAATSHDFWLKNLGPSIWKVLHLFVLAAYGLILAHVFLGALQFERSFVFPGLLGAGFVVLVGLHLAAFAKERRFDCRRHLARADGFEPVARTADLAPDAGKVVMAGRERVALFLSNGRVFAISNVCRHQGGPLGEGRIVKGCLTCPWHGYQYKVEDGCSPPPFTEVAPTYPVRIIDEEVFVNPVPLPSRTRSEGVPAATNRPASEEEFYIGWQAKCPPRFGRHTRAFSVGLLAAVPILLFVLAKFQNPVDTGAFEFGIARSFEGVLHEAPLPLLHVRAAGSPSGANFLLVGAGKFGPPDSIRGLDGRRVRFRGSLIFRNGVAMIEMNDPKSLEVLDARRDPLPVVTALGAGEFVGELVDTKCFFGVMRPATGKVHRGCAIRCLSGGAPPGLLVHDGQGNDVVLLLAALPGKELDLDVSLAARTLQVRGELEMHSGTPVLRIASYQLVHP